MRWLALGIVAIVALAAFAGAYFVGLIPLTGRPGTCEMNQTGSIPLPNLAGRIDHMAFSPRLQSLYVAALGNNSVDVVNVTSSQIRVIAGLAEPQGVLYVSSSDQVYVANGGTGVVNVFGGSTLVSVANISLGSDADNIRYDQNSNLVYVGYGQGGIAVINVTARTVIGTIQLSGHPEGFQVDTTSGKVFVNVPTSGYIAVADTITRAVTDRWPLANATGNYPMALDQAHGRLFVGTRSPAQLIVIDSGTGKTIVTLSIPSDPDDIYYDGANGCIYISSGSGYLTSVRQSDPSHYTVVKQLVTSTNARTSLLVPEQALYFVAAPATQSSPARIIEYKIT